MNYDEYENTINELKGSLDETSQATVADSLITLKSAFKNKCDNIDELNKSINDLKTENESLLKTNGKLYQRLSQDVNNTNNPLSSNELVKEEKIKPEDIINEKGELI